MRIDEINTRLAEIHAMDMSNITGDALTALEKETDDLIAERQQLQNEAQTRQQLREKVASGIVPATITETIEEEPKMERTFTPASEEYRSAFLKNMRGEEMNEVEKRAFTFLTTNTPAPLPTVMQNRIIDLIGEQHPIVADVYTMNSGAAISIPVAKAIAADAGLTEEGADAYELQITFDNIDLSGDDYTANIEMSYKMAAMAIPAFEDYLVAKIAERLGAKLAAKIVINISEGMAQGNIRGGEFGYATLCEGFGALKRTGKVVVYCNRSTLYNKLVGMVDSNKRPIFQQSINEGAAGVLLGAPIKVEEAVADNQLLVGDPDKYLQNVVAPIMIESDKDLKKHKYIYSGYTCQEGTLTDDQAFALVMEGEK